MKPSYRVTLINGQIITTGDISVTNLRFPNQVPTVSVVAVVAGNQRSVTLFAHAVAMIEEL